jgi:hypothetical protein
MSEVETNIAETAAPELAPIPPNRPRKVYGGMWGPLEIGAVAAGALVMLAAMLAYFFFVIPSNRELATNKSKAGSLEAELISARAKYGEITDTETQVTKVLTSVDDFETRFLPAVSNGQNALYQRLNGLILSYGLINTTGPDYTPLEMINQNSGQQSDEEKGREKFRSLYPGVYVTTTVEGTYQNLRRFIREIETGNEFIIVSAIELAPSENEGQKEQRQNQVAKQQVPNPAMMPPGGLPPGINPMVAQQPQNQPQNQPMRPRGKMHGETVALHIEMAAYFRRPNFVPMAPTQQ